MQAGATLRAQRVLTGMASAIGLLWGLSACPAFAFQQIGWQYIIDFDEFNGDGSVTTITYGDFMIMGGDVQTGRKDDFPAYSSPNVYYSDSGYIYTSSDDGLSLEGADGWPAIGAWVTPSRDPVTATFTGYEPSDTIIGIMTTSGSDANQFLGMTDPRQRPIIFAVSFSSKAPFAIDNLTYGLPDIPFGIPEPASWALMLVGLGGLGLASRSRAKAFIAG